MPGRHHWPGAPEKTAFLRNSHRHLFHFEVDIPVNHDDRDVEFFDFQNQLANALYHGWRADGFGTYDFKNNSCEMLASWVLDQFPAARRCTVSEDGENLGGAER